MFMPQRDVPAARVPELDGLRGLAILLVLAWHYLAVSLGPGAGLPGSLLQRLLGTAWSGVDLFFVLSGFLIGGILLDQRDSPDLFKTFYLRRLCRIFPLYFIWVLLFVLLLWTAPQLVARGPLDQLFEPSLPLWSYLTYTQNIVMASSGSFGPHWLGITWSLAVEEQFYLVLPLIVVFFPLKKLPYLLAALIASAPVLRLLLFNFYPGAGLAAYVLMPCRADALLLGVLGAYLLRAERPARMIREHRKALCGALAVLFAGIVALTLRTPAPGSRGMTLFGYTWIALFYSCLVLLAATGRDGIISRLTRASPLRKLGLISFGLYIFHQALNWLCHGLILGRSPHIEDIAGLLTTMLALGLTVGLAALSWRYFEKRFVALGHSFRYERRGADSPAVRSLDSVPLENERLTGAVL